MLLYEAHDCQLVVSWISKEAQKKLHVAVTGSSSHTADCRIQIAYTHGQCFYCIGKSKLLIIMGMNTHFFIVLGCYIKVFVTESLNLFRIKSTEAVYQINDINTALCQQFQSCLQIILIDL